MFIFGKIWCALYRHVLYFVWINIMDTDTQTRSLRAMLRAVINIHWKNHPTLSTLYWNIPPKKQCIQEREIMTQLGGESYRKVARGRPCKSYTNLLANDKSSLEEDLPTLMSGKKERRAGFRRTGDINSTW